MKAFETWDNPERECSSCSCFNGEVICGSLQGCTTPAMPPGVTRPPPPPVCGWSDWINDNNPSPGKSTEILTTVNFFIQA